MPKNSPSKKKSVGKKSAGKKSVGKKSTGKKSAGRKSAGRKSAGRKSAGKRSPGKGKSPRTGGSQDDQFTPKWYHSMPEMFKKANPLAPGGGIAWQPPIPKPPPPPYNPPPGLEGRKIKFVEEGSDEAKNSVGKLNENDQIVFFDKK